MTSPALTPSPAARRDGASPSSGAAQTPASVPRPALDGLDIAASSGRFSLGLLGWMRWLIFGVEAAAVALGAFVFHLHFPVAACLGVIAVGAGANLLLTYGPAKGARATDSAYTIQLALNVVQLTVLLALTGGSANPFCLLLIVPASLAASTLKDGRALAICLFAAAATVGLSLWDLPLAWPSAPSPTVPPPTRLAAGLAVLVGISATSLYSWRVAVEAARMELALNFTQTVLAREQRLSALGGLAAAAAHELGTPLATIAIVAKEMAREVGEGALRDDAELLVSQAERCREILRRLTEE
ncbi:MAG: sensor histidine kinase, partial [Caulobacteraceae bacterium]|nr:sensor histidine kinase [Caulobacteraceae bacterium]